MGLMDIARGLFKIADRIAAVGAKPATQAATAAAPVVERHTIRPIRGGGPRPGPKDTADAFLGPGEPIEATAGNAPPRSFQYQPGTNISFSPRAGEGMSFGQLRALADYSLVRIIIEHVKDSLKSHEWDITVEEGFESSQFEADIRAAVAFFDSPDGDHAWDEWLGMLVEEVLVIDALTIYKHKTYDGSLSSLEIIDGSTIKVLCDERGFVPQSPAPAYQQILYGVPRSWYTRDEMVYAPRNRRVHKFYGFSPIEQIITKINEGMRRDFYNLAQFSDGTTPAGIATLPKEWSLEQIKGFDLWFNEILAGNAQRRSKLFWAPEGTKVEKFKDDEIFGLFNKYDEWLARVTCFAFGVSPMAFVAMTNRSVAEELGDAEAEGAVAAVKLFVERILNRIIDKDLGKPWLRFNWVTDRARLQAKRVNKNVEYTKAGIFTIDEVRAEEGKDPIPGGDVPYFNGKHLGAEDTPQGVEAAAPSLAPEVEGGVPARPVLPDGSRPVINAQASAALRKAALDEIDKWERYALKRIDEGKHADAAQFEAEYIPLSDCLALTRGLTKIKSKDQVRDLFAARRAGVKALRLEVASPGDIAPHTQKLRDALRGVLAAKAREVVEG